MLPNKMKLTTKQTRTIEALLVCESIEATAKKVNIAKSTLYRWLKNETFKSEFSKAKFRLLSNAITTLQRVSTKAVNVLIEVMVNKENPASTRVNSARIVLEQAIKGSELEDLEKRIAVLEEVGND